MRGASRSCGLRPTKTGPSSSFIIDKEARSWQWSTDAQPREPTAPHVPRALKLPAAAVALRLRVGSRHECKLRPDSAGNGVEQPRREHNGDASLVRMARPAALQVATSCRARAREHAPHWLRLGRSLLGMKSVPRRPAKHCRCGCRRVPELVPRGAVGASGSRSPAHPAGA